MCFSCLSRSIYRVAWYRRRSMVLIQLSIILIFCRFYDVFSVCQEDSWYCWRSGDKEYCTSFLLLILSAKQEEVKIN